MASANPSAARAAGRAVAPRAEGPAVTAPASAPEVGDAGRSARLPARDATAAYLPSGTAASDWGPALGTAGASGVPVRPPPVSPRALLTADPLLDVLAVLEAEVGVLRDLTPRSDVPDALARVAARLRAALVLAADGDAWVTTEDAARARRLSESAVRWRIKRGKLRAEWHGGRWWIRRADVEAM